MGQGMLYFFSCCHMMNKKTQKHMNLLQRLKQILAIRIPNWVGILCYSVMAILVIVLALVLIFPEETGNFIIEHDIRFL
jgi:uncharacterized protein involved in cysteine biosynthesis